MDRARARALLSVFGLIACVTAASATDIAFYVGQWNTDGWYDASQFDDVAEIIYSTQALFGDVREFDDSSFPAFDDWIEANTSDGELDIIWLNGCTPSVLYPYPNQMPDGSPAEAWLDGGNMFINVGDWFAYVSYECGWRCYNNASYGAANILDLSPNIIIFGNNTRVYRTPAGAEYFPNLPSTLRTDRPVMTGRVQFPWEVAAAFATDTGDEAGASRADPIVLHNVETDGYLAVINQKNGASTWIDRSTAVTEFLTNWAPSNAVGYTPPTTQAIVSPPEGKVGETELSLRAVLFGQGDVTFTVRRSGDAFGSGRPLGSARLDTDGRGETRIVLPAYLPRGPALVDAVSTSGSAATASLLIDSPINNAPVPTPQELVTEEDTELFFTLMASDLNEDALQFDLQDLPSHGDLNGVTPDLSYTPAAGFSGEDSFTFWVNDGDDKSELATITITVLPVNDAPVASSDTTVTAEDTPVAIVLSATDADDDPLTYTVVRPPTNGTLSGTAPELTYTPHADATGQDVFDFSVSDGVDESGSASVTVIVSAVDDAPTLAELADVTIRADGTLHMLPLPGVTPGGGEDEVAQTVHVAATSSDTSILPDPVVEVDANNHALVFAPALGAVGDVTIAVVATDTGLGNEPHSNRATRELVVHLLPPAPAVQTTSVGPNTPSRAGVEIDVLVEAKWIAAARFSIEGISAAQGVPMSLADVGDGVIRATGAYVVRQEDENVREAAVIVSATNAAGEAATVTPEGAVTVDTVASILSAEAAPREVRKGELLSLIVEAESGATVEADVTALDARAAEPVRLVEDSDARGVYQTTISVSADSTAAAGSKLVAYQVTDAAGNTASDAIGVVLVGDTTFTVDLHAGSNLIHVPVRTDDIRSASDLYAKLGGFEQVAACC